MLFCLKKLVALLLCSKKFRLNWEQKFSQALKIPVIGLALEADATVRFWSFTTCSESLRPFRPRFLRRYLNLAEEIQGAVNSYVQDVKSQDFPNEKEQY